MVAQLSKESLPGPRAPGSSVRGVSANHGLAQWAWNHRTVEPLIHSGELWRLLSRPRPSHLYHYTGPAGVIGILKSRALWAGRPADMNDSTEQLLAHAFAQESLARLVFPRRSFGEGMVQYALENIAGPRTWGESSRAYTVSLTSEMDSLEQWRAYCPRSGGVALGFATDHLENVAKDQGFLLAPCTYDELTQRAVVEQIVKIGRAHV